MVNIELDDITVNNKGVLKTINESVLPTKYTDEFYEKSPTEGFSKLAFYGEVPVGGVKASLVVPQHHTTPTSVYIESLAVLKPYRNIGIGQKLVEFVIEQAKQSYIHEVTLHVWINNPDVLKWYAKLGFEEKERIENYYKEQKLDEPTAILLSKKF